MTAIKASLVDSLTKAATDAGLVVLSHATAANSQGYTTTIFQLALPSNNAKTLQLELSEGFDFDKPELLPELTHHLAAQAKRLRNPRPEAGVTFGGLPIAFGKFEWPFHTSTSGADTHIVHGEMHLADGGTHNLHAKLSASVTLTFADFVPAMEQPYAESFIYNAIRKTVDLGQLEFLKSGNRQPVPVTTRYWSRWEKKFIFTEATEQQRIDYLLLKVYWLSGVLGNSEPVWIADPRDAQYLNSSTEELVRLANLEAADGYFKVDGEYAAATPKLLEKKAEYDAKLEAALNFTKPQFNEEMRSGHANM